MAIFAGGGAVRRAAGPAPGVCFAVKGLRADVRLPKGRRLQEYGPLEPERFSLDKAHERLAQREDLVRWRRA